MGVLLSHALRLLQDLTLRTGDPSGTRAQTQRYEMSLWFPKVHIPRFCDILHCWPVWVLLHLNDKIQGPQKWCHNVNVGPHSPPMVELLLMSSVCAPLLPQGNPPGWDTRSRSAVWIGSKQSWGSKRITGDGKQADVSICECKDMVASKARRGGVLPSL